MHKLLQLIARQNGADIEEDTLPFTNETSINVNGWTIIYQPNVDDIIIEKQLTCDTSVVFTVNALDYATCKDEIVKLIVLYNLPIKLEG